MNCTQNKRIEQITEKTLIIGADIAKKSHVARAQDFRRIEYGKRLVFTNTHQGLKRLVPRAPVGTWQKRSPLWRGTHGALLVAFGSVFAETGHSGGTGQPDARFLSEVGDLSGYAYPQQIVKLAGLNLKENSSGKHKGQTRITKRGRPRLRSLLFKCALVMVAKNPDFLSLHRLLTTRRENPLKKKQSLNRSLWEADPSSLCPGSKTGAL